MVPEGKSCGCVFKNPNEFTPPFIQARPPTVAGIPTRYSSPPNPYFEQKLKIEAAEVPLRQRILFLSVVSS